MTYINFKKASLTALATIAIAASLPTASAMASDAPARDFVVKSTTDGRIKLGVKAFKSGDFERAVSWNKQATRASLSRRKTAVAYSNLCASYAKLGKLNEASEACSLALDLRPDYAPAAANKASLTIRLAQK